MVEGGLHNLYAEKEPIRSEAIKDTVDWVVAASVSDMAIGEFVVLLHGVWERAYELAASCTLL